jgi:hypothetical protein
MYRNARRNYTCEYDFLKWRRLGDGLCYRVDLHTFQISNSSVKCGLGGENKNRELDAHVVALRLLRNNLKHVLCVNMMSCLFRLIIHDSKHESRVARRSTYGISNTYSSKAMDYVDCVRLHEVQDLRLVSVCGLGRKNKKEPEWLRCSYLPP